MNWRITLIIPVFLFVTCCWQSFSHAFPTLLSNDNLISLEPAAIRLETFFDQLIDYNIIEAHNVLDNVLLSLTYLAEYRSHSRSSHSRQRHIEDCNDTARFYNRGQNGADILQMLLIDHLSLLMSIQNETKFLMNLMFSIYIHDKADPREIPTIPRTSADIKEVLRNHARERHYQSWQTILI